jgi:pyruvate kinase
MGLEYGPEEVPGLQKRILDAALRHGRIAITATQMLETMTTAMRPTRAEASDVANAVFDGSDAVMLSAETAVGLHPALVVSTMDRILRAAEADPHCPYAGDPRHPAPDADARRPDRLIVRAAVKLAQEAGVAAVVVFTRGGHSARRLAKERPRAPIYAFAPDEAVARGLLLSWGVLPRRLPAGRSTDAVVAAVLRRLRAEEHVPRGSRVVLVVGGGTDPAGTTTLVRLATV